MNYNNEEQISKLLARFKDVAPRAEFLHTSKATITRFPQEHYQIGSIAPRIFERFKFAAAFSFAALLLVVGVAGTSYMERLSPVLAQSMQADVISNQAQLANFQIHIKEARYYDQTAEQVAVALDEIAGNPRIRR